MQKNIKSEYNLQLELQNLYFTWADLRAILVQDANGNFVKENAISDDSDCER